MKKFPAFYATQSFITVFTRFRHLPSYSRSVKSTAPSCILKIHFKILSLLRLGLTSVLSPYASPPQPYIHLIPFPFVLHAQPISSWDYHPNNIWWGMQIMELLIVQFSPLPRYLVRLSPKYLPQHPIFKHPQPVFLPQCEIPSFTPV